MYLYIISGFKLFCVLYGHQTIFFCYWFASILNILPLIKRLEKSLESLWIKQKIKRDTYGVIALKCTHLF